MIAPSAYLMLTREIPSRVWPLPCGVSPQHRQYLAADVAGAHWCRQEYVCRGQLLRLGWTLHRYILPELGNLLRLGIGGVQRSPDRSWGHGIHPDSPVHQVLSQRLGECVNSSLGGGIIQQALAAFDPGDRSGVDDGTAFAE